MKISAQKKFRKFFFWPKEFLFIRNKNSSSLSLPFCPELTETVSDKFWRPQDCCSQKSRCQRGYMLKGNPSCCCCGGETRSESEWKLQQIFWTFVSSLYVPFFISFFLSFLFLSSCLCTFPSFSLACCPYNSAMLSFYRSFWPFVIYLNWAFYFTPSAFLFWHSVLFLYSFIKKYFSCVLSSLIVTPL